MAKKIEYLGNFITQLDNRVRDSKKTYSLFDIAGISSITKEFTKTKANLVDVTVDSYKICPPNCFAYNPNTARMGDKIPIALNNTNCDILVSSIYPVFKLDEAKILSEYLLLFFKREEFDRYARYMSTGSAREIFDWDEMCRVNIPVLDLSEQQRIVNAYKTVDQRIRLLQQINENLEVTAQCLLEKSCNSANNNVVLGDIAIFIDGDRGSNYPTISDFYDNEFCLFLNASNVTDKGFNFDKCQFITEEKDKSLRKGHLSYNDIILTSRGTVGNVAIYINKIPYKNVRINSGMLIIQPKENKIPNFFLYALLRSSKMKNEIERFKSGSAQPQLPIRDLEKMSFKIPQTEDCLKIEPKLKIFYETIVENLNEISELKKIKHLVLSHILNNKED